MTEDQNYFYDEGFRSALQFIKKHIEIIQPLYPDSVPLISVQTAINQIQHSRADIDRIAEKLITKISELERK
jgi:hypothetical protein